MFKSGVTLSANCLKITVLVEVVDRSGSTAFCKNELMFHLRGILWRQDKQSWNHLDVEECCYQAVRAA
jgi:hypothetical protein